ncbi:MAG: SdpI family protein [Pseudomonadota bacterium]
MRALRTKGLSATAVGLVITVGIALLAPAHFVEGLRVPIHWGLNGADRFTSPETAALSLWGMPGACLLAGFLFSVMPILDPFRENLERSYKAYNAVWTGAIALFVFIQLGLAGALTGMFVVSETLPRGIFAAIGLFFLVIGNYMPKTRANFIFGIRTPWTLTSDTAWEKTHRLGGRLFILAGFLAMALAVVADRYQMGVLFAAILVPLITTLFVYSFFVWRKAEDRMSSSDYIV